MFPSRESELTERRLRRMPLPWPGFGDKEARGRVLIVGGAACMPGAAILAGISALRAGAGKLQIATAASVAPAVAVAVPEAMIVALAESDDGTIAPASAHALADAAGAAHAIVVGPGMIDEAATGAFVERLLVHCTNATVVLDALALACLHDVPELLHPLEGRAVLTPHAGETARMTGREIDEVRAHPAEFALQTARQLRAVVAVKGAQTHIASPSGDRYRHRGGCIGLATSGSGDTLAGLIGGFAARGADPLQALLWGVKVHALAGARLSEKIGPLGFLARELPAEFPAIVHALSR